MDLQRNRQQTQKGQDFTLEINTKSFRKSETSLKKLIEQVNIELSNTKVNSELLHNLQKDINDNLIQADAAINVLSSLPDTDYAAFNDSLIDIKRTVTVLRGRIAELPYTISEDHNTHAAVRSTRSVVSASSKRSSTSSKREQAAALQQRLRDSEALKKKRDSINEAKREQERQIFELNQHHQKVIEERAYELERMETEAQLREIEAMISVEPENLNEANINRNAISTSENTKDFPTSQNTILAHTPLPKHENATLQNTTCNHEIPVRVPVIRGLESHSHNVIHRTMPAFEPTIFSGNPLYYAEWACAFDSLVENPGTLTTDKIHYLSKYLGGEAKEAVRGYFSTRTEEGYKKAREILEKRYGNNFITAESFRSKIENWPKISSKDHKGLQHFSDFLLQIETTSESVRSLGHLNDMRVIAYIATKLPDFLLHKWQQKCGKFKEEEERYPEFKEFARFVQRESDIANDPVIHCHRTNQTSTTSRVTRTLASVTLDQIESDSSSTKKECAYCHSAKHDHYLPNCESFSKLPINEREDFIKKEGRCFLCLRKGHRSRECKKPHTCKTCNESHPTVLHKTKNQIDENVTARISMKVNTRCPTRSTTTSILPVWVSSKSDPKKEVLVYALADTGSDATFIDNSVVKQLNLPIESHTQLKIETIVDQERSFHISTIQSDIQVRGYMSNEYIDLPSTYSVPNIPLRDDSIPTKQTAENWPHLHEIKSELPPPLNIEMGLLIGHDCHKAFIPREIKVGRDDEPFAVKTDLGWSVMGPSKKSSSYETKKQAFTCHRILVKEHPILKPSDACRVLEADFSNEKEGEKTSQEDLKFLQILETNITKDSRNHLQMPLPFRKKPDFPNNRFSAHKRLEYLKKKLSNNPKLFDEYKKFMDTIIERGDAEETVGGEDQEWYLPHHGVLHPKKKKLRVVFDCSASYKGSSLNDNLLTGPNLINNLTGVFARFRSGNIAFSCDVEKMFHQFVVDEKDRKFLKFLWWKNGDLTTEPVTYRMNVHLFGAASSPGCANFGLKYLARENEASHPEAAKFIKDNFYVDDGLASLDSEEKAIELIKTATEICSAGGLRLHKFASNNATVLNSIPLSERSEINCGVKNVSLSTPDMENERTLGMEWSVEKDTLHFSNIDTTAPNTRRGLLSTVGSLYDPMGLIAPYVLKGKSILQEACNKSSKWDEPIEGDTLKRWVNWKEELDEIGKITVNRCYRPPGFGKSVNTQLHHFSDASQTGYGMCSYLRFVNEKGDVHCSLVVGKARVAPMKAVSIPRLELTAALVSAEIGKKIKNELNMDIDEEFFWTDSKVVLGYINNDVKRFHVFVANRVQRIKDLTSPSQWRYVSTHENPADHASRGLTITQLIASNWFPGPQWLWDSNLTIPSHISPNLQSSDPEVRISLNVQMKPVSFDLNEKLSNISKWTKAVGTVGRILRLANKTKHREHILTTSEKQRASDAIIRNIQQTFLAHEYTLISAKKQLPKKNPLAKAEPFLHDGILRVGGRVTSSSYSFSEKHPIILPKCHLTNLIVDRCHKLVKHQGQGMTMNELRTRGYWIIGGSRLIAKSIKSCVTCRKLRGKVMEQRMADLPDERTEPTPPFTHVGVDTFGPITVKNGRKECKRYGLLFTCLCSRAVHVEMLDDISTDSFINGLRCFISIRGRVEQIFCDKGTNFVGANNEFMKCLKDKLQTQFEECQFIFNPPDASNCGGVWERQVKTVKTVLSAITTLHPGKLDDSSLRTFLYEAMSIVNSRPLTTIFQSDPLSPVPLTPNHVLTMKSKSPSPPPGPFHVQDLYLKKRWRRVQYLLQQFWARWKKEYIASISKRQKWLHPTRNLQQGDIVLIVDEDISRNQWRMAKVIETLPSKDGLVRRARVQVATSNLDAKGRRLHKSSVIERPIQKLVLLKATKQLPQ